MNFGFSEEQAELRKMVKRSLEEKAPETEVRRVMATDEGYDPAVWSMMANELALQGLGIPEEFGGTPVDPKTEVQTFAMIYEEISRGDCGLADKLVQIWKTSVLLRNILPQHLKELWFPRIVNDPSFLLSHCLTEPRGASDRWLPYDVPEAMMQTKAVKKGDR
jgi:alkylation response protein AidB-like acyl-CoA dehydrogenase